MTPNGPGATHRVCLIIGGSAREGQRGRLRKRKRMCGKDCQAGVIV